MFISALAEISSRKRFSLSFGHLFEKAYSLGYSSSKHIEVFGVIGELAGANMDDGTLICHGSTGSSLGMGDGTIVVKGNAWQSVGGGMRGGVIAVKGNLEMSAEVGLIGHSMEGGTIHC